MKKITLTESDIRNIVTKSINEVFNGVYSDAKQQSIEQFMQEYAGEDGYVDDNRVAADCLELLKANPRLTISRTHNFVKLPNNCCIGMSQYAIDEGAYDLWEILYPDGSVWDGTGIDEDIDEGIQEELYYHVIEK